MVRTISRLPPDPALHPQAEEVCAALSAHATRTTARAEPIYVPGLTGGFRRQAL